MGNKTDDVLACQCVCVSGWFVGFCVLCRNYFVCVCIMCVCALCVCVYYVCVCIMWVFVYYVCVCIMCVCLMCVCLLWVCVCIMCVCIICVCVCIICICVYYVGVLCVCVCYVYVCVFKFFNVLILFRRVFQKRLGCQYFPYSSMIFICMYYYVCLLRSHRRLNRKINKFYI